MQGKRVIKLRLLPISLNRNNFFGTIISTEISIIKRDKKTGKAWLAVFLGEHKICAARGVWDGTRGSPKVNTKDNKEN